MTKTQLRILRKLRSRLDTKDAGHTASEEITEAFDGPCNLYLGTWVLPLIQALIDNGSGLKDADQILYDLGGADR